MGQFGHDEGCAHVSDNRVAHKQTVTDEAGHRIIDARGLGEGEHREDHPYPRSHHLLDDLRLRVVPRGEQRFDSHRLDPNLLRTGFDPLVQIPTRPYVSARNPPSTAR